MKPDLVDTDNHSLPPKHYFLYYFAPASFNSSKDSEIQATKTFFFIFYIFLRQLFTSSR